MKDPLNFRMFPDQMRVQREIYRPTRSVWCRGAAETARILIYKCETSRPSLPAVISSCVKEVVKQARSKNCVSLNLEFIAVLNSWASSNGLCSVCGWEFMEESCLKPRQVV